MPTSFTNYRSALTALLAAATLTWSTSTLAAEASYGDLAGDTVTYRNVFESGDVLLNTPTVTGDRLVFSPLGSEFSAVAVFGGDSDQLENNIATILVASPGNALDHATVTASGTYNLFAAPGSGSPITSVKTVVTTTASIIDYQEFDGTPVYLDTPVELTSQTETIAEAAFNSGDPLSGTWLGSSTLDFATLAEAEASIDGYLTRVGLTINTALIAVSENGTESRISLRAFDALTITIAPEPGTAAMLIAPAIACLARRRNRR